jgi:hypothetical protein
LTRREKEFPSGCGTNLVSKTSQLARGDARIMRVT